MKKNKIFTAENKKLFKKPFITTLGVGAGIISLILILLILLIGILIIIGILRLIIIGISYL